MIPWLDPDDPFPPVAAALRVPGAPNGLLAAGADLSPQRLLAAYRRGIFPWFAPGEPLNDVLTPAQAAVCIFFSAMFIPVSAAWRAEARRSMWRTSSPRR